MLTIHINIIKAISCFVLFTFTLGCTSTAENTINNTSTQASAQTSLPLKLNNEISAHKAVSEMAIGINLGNTLDAPLEGDWALPAEKSFIIAFKNAGFKHVRIPVTWHHHTQQVAPFKIDEKFLTRVEQVVDWALAEDLYVILNAHHESWFKNDYSANLPRFNKIWLQLAERFKQKSAKLAFEILNEPTGMTMQQVNKLNRQVLALIRNHNPNRLVIYSGNGYTPLASLLSAEIPDIDDKFLIGNFHSYDPWNFAGKCIQTWGSHNHQTELRKIYQKANQWSNDNQIPVMINEFGAAKYDHTAPENVCDLQQRLDYLKHHVSLAKEYAITGTFWDDGGSFSTFDRRTNTWGPEKDILVTTNN
ncbi:glycoside hydrolase family 5 protein [Paraglaciecola sp. L3A3]|uniref:glycoside hydrolase family 5 protein n=1 Tax=Paraglaciecola sp. L3A3 TaxID=2686358 RepID=UPI001E65A8BB|nr:glycoside hydrolase family 5 protein [Paraglaciecola sp. L3A3]